MKSCRRRVVGLVVSVAALIALAGASSAGASSVTQWNANATSLVTGAAGWQAPPVSILHLAMMHGAVYDAVNAIDGGYTAYLVSPDVAPFDPQDTSAAEDAAAATAAYLVLFDILSSPGLATTSAPGMLPTLAIQYTAALGAIPAGAAKTSGIDVGMAAAAAMITNRTGDGRYGACCFPVPAVPQAGQWRPELPSFVNDPNGWIRNVKTFMIESSSQFRTKGPWALTSPQYTREFNEVKSLGGLADTALTDVTRTDHQTDAALYWAAHPAATWSRIVRGLDGQAGLSTADAARLYAQLYLTAADSAISVWDEKAYWSFWRPITAIREAGTDGNPDTAADPDWLPLVATPPYPDHSSGHLGLSGSMVETLQEFFNTDQMSWTDTAAGKTMSYTRLSDALNEIIDVRIWSGIHFRAADEQSAHLAKLVAKWRKHHYFKKAH
jgi:hypothetical protein